MIGRERRRRRRRETRVQPPLETGHWRRTQRPIPWRLRVIALDLACTCTIHGVARSLWRGGEQRFVGLSRGRVMPSWETWPLGGDAISLRSAIPGREEMEGTRLFEVSKDQTFWKGFNELLFSLRSARKKFVESDAMFESNNSSESKVGI